MIFCATLPVPLNCSGAEGEKTTELQLIEIKANKELFLGCALYKSWQSERNGHSHGSTGHCSSCTIKVIADYIIDGTLTNFGTACQPDRTAYKIYELLKTPLLGNNTINTTSVKRSPLNIHRRFIRRTMTPRLNEWGIREYGL